MWRASSTHQRQKLDRAIVDPGRPATRRPRSRRRGSFSIPAPGSYSAGEVVGAALRPPPKLFVLRKPAERCTQPRSWRHAGSRIRFGVDWKAIGRAASRMRWSAAQRALVSQRGEDRCAERLLVFLSAPRPLSLRSFLQGQCRQLPVAVVQRAATGTSGPSVMRSRGSTPGTSVIRTATAWAATKSTRARPPYTYTTSASTCGHGRTTRLAALSQLSSCFCGARAGPAALCTSVLQPLPFDLVAGCVWQLTNNQAGAGLWPAATSPAARRVQLRPRASHLRSIAMQPPAGIPRSRAVQATMPSTRTRARHTPGRTPAARPRRPRRRRHSPPRSRRDEATEGPALSGRAAQGVTVNDPFMRLGSMSLW